MIQTPFAFIILWEIICYSPYSLIPPIYLIALVELKSDLWGVYEKIVTSGYLLNFMFAFIGMIIIYCLIDLFFYYSNTKIP